MKLQVSIIIASYNTAGLTLDCISSIKKESSKINYEIIVVDNGSSDGSVEKLDKLSIRNKNLVVIKNNDNLGFSKAVNQGIRIAKGKYILLLNSDTVVTKNCLKNLLDFAEKQNNLGVAGAQLLNPDGSIQPSCRNFPTVKNAILEYWLGKRGLFEKFNPKGPYPKEVNAVVGAAFLITPEALKIVGLMDEKYFFYYEDLDYCRRVWKSGLKVYYLPAAKVIHYHGASGKDIVDPLLQWRRLIPSSKIYNGILTHYLLNFILWSGQKWQRLLNI